MPVSLTEPKQTISGANESRWLAINAQYPVPFTFQRQDFTATLIQSGGGFAQLVIAGDVSQSFPVGELVYFQSSKYPTDTAIVSAATFSSPNTLITLSVQYAGTDDAGSYTVNLLSSRSDYEVKIEIYAGDNLDLDATIQIPPFIDGSLEFDISGFLQPKTLKQPSKVFPAQGTAVDGGLYGVPFFIRYYGTYSGVNDFDTTEPVPSSGFYVAVNRAQQIGSLHGANIGEYLCFNADLDEQYKGKFFTAFEKIPYYTAHDWRVGFAIETEGATPGITLFQRELNGAGVQLAQQSQALTISDFRHVNFLNLIQPFAAGTETVEFWLESDLTTGGCNITDEDWIFDQWQVDTNNGELLGVYVNPDTPDTQIFTVDTRPDGTLYDDNNNVVDIMQWNAAQGWYEPQNGPHILTGGAWRIEILNIDITTKVGDNCPVSFIQSYDYTGNLNQIPEARNVALSSERKEGEDITLDFEFFDGDSDPAASGTFGNHEWEIRSYANFADIGNRLLGTVIASGLDTGISASNTYTLAAAEVGLYVRAWVKVQTETNPVQESAWTPSNTIGPIISGNVAMSFDYAAPGTLDFDLLMLSGSDFCIDWGDGTTTVVENNSTQDFTNYSHTYSGSGDQSIQIFAPSNTLRGIQAQNKGLKNTVDMSGSNSIAAEVYLDNNPGILGFIQPSGGEWSFLFYNNTGIVGTLNTSNMIGFSGSVFYAYGNSGMTGLNIGTASNNYQRLWVQSNSIAGAQDWSGCQDCFDYRFDSNSITGITFPSSSNAAVVRVSGRNNSLSGTLDMSGFTSGQWGEIRLENNAGLTGLSFYGTASAHTGAWSTIRAFNCDLTGTLDLSMFENMGGALRLSLNSNLTAITMPSTASGTMSSLEIESTGIATIDISALVNWTDTALFSLASCASLASITGAAWTSGKALAFDISNTLLATYANSYVNHVAEFVPGGDKIVSGCGFDTAALDSIWSDFSTKTLTNGTDTYDSSGQTTTDQPTGGASNADVVAVGARGYTTVV